MLKESEAHRISQADIATEVSRRVIAFSGDEKTMSELRLAGARSFLLDAIDRAARNAGRPLASEPQVPDDEAKARAQAEAAGQAQHAHCFFVA